MDLSDVIDRFRGPLIGLIVSWGTNYTDATEIAQDSFADAYLNRDSCRGDWQDPEVFGRWLRGIARNKFRNEWRSRNRRERRVISVDRSALEAAANPSFQREDERLEHLRAAIDALPAKLKQVVMMHYLEVTSVKNVAALLSVSAKTVEGRLYQARRELRRTITKTSSSWIGKAVML